MEEKEIIKALARELAKRDLGSLEEFISGMKFNDAQRLLNGFNCENWINNDGVSCSTFDTNYKSISTTIYKKEDGYCFLYGKCDVWLSEISSPIATIDL